MRDGADAWCRIGDESLSLLQIRMRKKEEEGIWGGQSERRAVSLSPG